MSEQEQDERHRARQQRLKEQVDARIAAASDERGLLLVITGNGKGKSSSGFGMVARAVGHGQQAAVVQFIKGDWECGERNLLQRSGVPFAVMATGFTWETQNRAADQAAAQVVWQQAKAWLADASIDLVLLDELTYMIQYDYIELDEVLASLAARPPEQSAVVTGRGAHRRLLELADTVSEVRNVKHAFDAGLKARRGVDW